MLDSYSIHRGTFWMLDSFSIHRDPFAMNTSRQILDSSSTVNLHVFILDSSRHLSIHRETWISIYRVCVTFLSFLIDLSQQFTSFHLPTIPLLLQTSFPCDFRPRLRVSSLVRVLNPSFFMHFTHQTQVFGFLKNFWDFSKLMKF